MAQIDPPDIRIVQRGSTPRQLESQSTARLSQAGWDRKLELLKRDYRDSIERDWVYKSECMRAVQEISRTSAGSQPKCVIHFLSVCTSCGWIAPGPFLDPTTETTKFYGWTGFRVLQPSKFGPAISWLFSLPNQNKCKDGTIQNFFITTAHMKPQNRKWKEAFAGEVSIVPIELVGSAGHIKYDRSVGDVAAGPNIFTHCFENGGLDKYLDFVLHDATTASEKPRVGNIEGNIKVLQDSSIGEKPRVGNREESIKAIKDASTVAADEDEEYDGYPWCHKDAAEVKKRARRLKKVTSFLSSQFPHLALTVTPMLPRQEESSMQSVDFSRTADLAEATMSFVRFAAKRFCSMSAREGGTATFAREAGYASGVFLGLQDEARGEGGFAPASESSAQTVASDDSGLPSFDSFSRCWYNPLPGGAGVSLDGIFSDVAAYGDSDGGGDMGGDHGDYGSEGYSGIGVGGEDGGGDGGGDGGVGGGYGGVGGDDGDDGWVAGLTQLD
jgi:hypothetical protein